MTNYYSPETCKQLEQLGCVASSGVWWRVYPRIEGDCQIVSTQSGEKPTDKETFVFYPAYSAADFLASPSAKENCIKLWGGDPYCKNCRIIGVDSSTWEGELHCNDCEMEITEYWQYQTHQLLDIILSGGDGESFIKQALEEL